MGSLEANWKLIILNSPREIIKIDGKACEKLASDWREKFRCFSVSLFWLKSLKLPWNALRPPRKANFSLSKLAKLPPKYASKHFRRLR
jgi:hypothetical protein